MIEGRPKFNALVITTVTLKYLSPGVNDAASIEATARFYNTATRMQHGETKAVGTYSKRVRDAAEELKRALEEDFAAVHFEGAEPSGAPPAIKTKPEEPVGLGELFKNGEIQEG